jgi:hypothetical protein
MIPAAFDYQRAASLDDALSALSGGDAKVIAGGMSLLPLMKLRLAPSSSTSATCPSCAATARPPTAAGRSAR